jgi:hypothetical protein
MERHARDDKRQEKLEQLLLFGRVLLRTSRLLAAAIQ